jgi:uncharacterized protein (UPF0332 family)
MSLTFDERKAVVEFRIEKARRALEQAQGVVELQYWETIANRLYYAAYNAVSAMLISYGYTAHSHDGVIHLFGQHFVKPGIVDVQDGKLYHHLFTMRLTGDYDDTYGLTSEDVLPLIEPASALIEKAISIATKKINESQA